LGIDLIPGNWKLRDDPLPALRRGLLVALPVGAGVLVDLQLDSPVAGAISTGALLAGFVAFEAPARTRFQWQLLVAPVLGGSAALGALTANPGALAAAAMTVFACLVGMTVAISLRLSLAGMVCVLALLLAQGFGLEPHDAAAALLLGGAGVLVQALLSLMVGLFETVTERVHPVAGIPAAVRAVRANLHLRSTSLRHALRWGIAIGIGVAVYHVIDLGQHGYWVPLTILFVLKPSPGDTYERLAMRAAGTFAGLLLATGLAVLVDHHPVVNAVVLTIAAACSFAFLAIEYALFTTAITIYIVVLAHALGQSAFEAVDERGIATAIGIVIAGLAFTVLRDVTEAAPSTAPS
jgi:Fusaric acid resistance protein-like